MRNWVLNAYKRGILTNSLNNFFSQKRKTTHRYELHWLFKCMSVCTLITYTINTSHNFAFEYGLSARSTVKVVSSYALVLFFLTWSNSIYLCKYWATCIFVKVVIWSLVGQVSVCTAENLHAPSTTVHTLHLNTVLSCNCIPAMQSFMMGSFF